MSPSLFEARDIRTAVIGPWDVTLPARTTTVMSGPSGSGKTLLLRCLADLDPHAGSLTLRGADSLDVDGPTWRSRVGFLPSECAWWGDRVGDHFPDHDAAFVTALGFDDDVLSWTVDRLSSGERQRLGLARLLAIGPRVLLLDEPTANLDAGHATSVEQLVKGYVSEDERAALWVSHDPAQWQRVGDRHYEIDADGLVEVGA
ncbi:MAG: ATP-binding cassette domain-containing protein [Gammaproteobacteria bacterium]|nr:ATP-binding cassette domain-containing protein [Gammaproteobacteria bacterium]